MTASGSGRDPAALLAEGGFPLEALSEEQLGVITTLTEEEAVLLLALKAKFDSVEPEVQAHSGVYAGGAMF